MITYTCIDCLHVDICTFMFMELRFIGRMVFLKEPWIKMIYKYQINRNPLMRQVWKGDVTVTVQVTHEAVNSDSSSIYWFRNRKQISFPTTATVFLITQGPFIVSHTHSYKWNLRVCLHRSVAHITCLCDTRLSSRPYSQQHKHPIHFKFEEK